MRNRLIQFVIILVVLAFAFHEFWKWTVDRKYVPEGSSLRLSYRGPPLPFLPGGHPQASPGFFAKVDEQGDPLEIGILEQMRGPGRHFYNPFWWDREVVPDVVVEPGEVAVVRSKLGENLGKNEFLVEGEVGNSHHKGMLRRVLGPGRYRINDYAYEHKKIKREEIQSGNQIKHAGWVEIKAGYVGVVTNLAPNPATGAITGIQEHVLPPGLYLINPYEQQIDIVNIGFRERSIVATLKTEPSGKLAMDASGEPALADDESGIMFPSNDGFNIHMDFTAIWGIMPDQAPEVIRKFGTVEAVETKVVMPQIESICRNMGSALGAVDLLVGQSRLKYQADVSTNFEKLMHEKGLTLLYGLVRHIYIPQEVRLPIQRAFLADELKLTLEQQQVTTQTEALLREAEQKVELEAGRTRSLTEKLVAQKIAEGLKTAEETRAETKQLSAAIERETAELEAQAQVRLGEAEASAKQMLAEAGAQKFVLAVKAFGSAQAYTQWRFATGLPSDVELKTLYAGPGTFWTDLRSFSDTMLGAQRAEANTNATKPK